MAVQVLPAEAGEVAFAIGAVVSEQKNRVAYYVLASIPDPDIIVGASDFGLGVFLVALRSVVGEDDKWGWCLQSVGQPIESSAFSRALANLGYAPCNEDNPCSCTGPSGAAHKCGM
jgi:hypothetical protein